MERPHKSRPDLLMYSAPMRAVLRVLSTIVIFLLQTGCHSSTRSLATFNVEGAGIEVLLLTPNDTARVVVRCKRATDAESRYFILARSADAEFGELALSATYSKLDGLVWFHGTSKQVPGFAACLDIRSRSFYTESGVDGSGMLDLHATEEEFVIGTMPGERDGLKDVLFRFTVRE